MKDLASPKFSCLGKGQNEGLPCVYPTPQIAGDASSPFPDRVLSQTENQMAAFIFLFFSFLLLPIFFFFFFLLQY